MTSLPPIAELLRHDPESRFQQDLAVLCTSSTRSYQEYYPAEVLIREFCQMQKNPGALEQRRSVGLDTLKRPASLDSGSSLDPIICAAILGSPSRRLRLADVRLWGKVTLTDGLKLAIKERLIVSELFALEPSPRYQRRGGWWIVVAEPPVRVAPRPPLPPRHVPLPGFDEFVKAESWRRAEVPDTGRILGTLGWAIQPTLM
ncbi:hypothetical protein JB92DRAFT_2968827 [Gautieria morchelliformis]|nr:hypothetical protein JB92DRAFT_2968827 [Gautieria morchelliformis]